jgi:hypothetical protein
LTREARRSSCRDAATPGSRLRREAPDTRLLLGGRGAAIDAASLQALGADAIARSGTSAAEAIRAWKQ